MLASNVEPLPLTVDQIPQKLLLKLPAAKNVREKGLLTTMTLTTFPRSLHQIQKTNVCDSVVETVETPLKMRLKVYQRRRPITLEQSRTQLVEILIRTRRPVQRHLRIQLVCLNPPGPHWSVANTVEGANH